MVHTLICRLYADTFTAFTAVPHVCSVSIHSVYRLPFYWFTTNSPELFLAGTLIFIYMNILCSLTLCERYCNNQCMQEVYIVLNYMKKIL
jgi:hypothetical protein